MATAVISAPANYTMIRPEARLGDDTVGPGLVDDLQNFYDKTDSLSDKAKCMELINAINARTSGKMTTVQRPVTAGPVLGGDHSKNFLSPYQTSYNRDYPLKQPIESVAIRPMTSQGFAPQMPPGPDTHYTEEFRWKRNQRPMTPLRPGTASGNRANNPHPPESFIVWKFPRSGWKETEGSKWSEQLTDEKINQVHKRLCQTTYQTDYLGSPQGFPLKSAFNLPPDWRENIPYTLDSVQRYCYQRQANPQELQLPTNRYGSNRKKQIAASGTIPTASSRHMHIRNRTTYDRHYNDNSDAVVQQIRDVGYKLEAEILRKYYEQAAGDDRQTAKNILEAYNVRNAAPAQATMPQAPAVPHPPPARPPSRMSYRSNTPSSTPISTPYVPVPAAKDPNASRLSFNVYSPPEALKS